MMERIHVRWAATATLVVALAGAGSARAARPRPDRLLSPGGQRLDGRATPPRARPPGGALTETSIDLGALVLELSDSRTAQVFHIVDQLSQWDRYAHKQYVRWAARALPLTPEDSALLRRHAALRRARGWGHGFEQAFLVDADIEQAAAAAAARGLLSPAESDEEKRILLHFAPRLDPLLRERAGSIAAFERELSAGRGRLAPIVRRLARFAGSTSVAHVPVFLVSNPEAANGGGEANGRRLVVEIPSPAPEGFLLHEALHGLLQPARGLIQAAADSAGIEPETLSEAIAYAVAPGLTDDPRRIDMLGEQVARYALRGASKDDPYLRFYTMALVLRPLVRSALDEGEPLSAFLPRAIERWRSFAPR